MQLHLSKRIFPLGDEESVKMRQKKQKKKMKRLYRHNESSSCKGLRDAYVTSICDVSFFFTFFFCRLGGFKMPPLKQLQAAAAAAESSLSIDRTHSGSKTSANSIKHWSGWVHPGGDRLKGGEKHLLLLRSREVHFRAREKRKTRTQKKKLAALCQNRGRRVLTLFATAKKKIKK